MRKLLLKMNNNYSSKNKNTGILELDFKRYKAICGCLDSDPDSNSGWRHLVATLDNTKFALKDVEREECARVLYHGMDSSPSNELLKKLDMKGMSLQTLIHYMDKSKMEKCLMYIKPQEPLVIIQQPAEQMTVDYGNKLEIVCKALGFPYPEYVWFKDNNKIYSDKTGVFVIKQTKLSDAGEYICRIQHFSNNGWQYTYSTACSVDVNSINNINDHSRYPSTILDGDSDMETLLQVSEMMKKDLCYLPQIIVQPTCQTNSYGGVVTFKVKAQHTEHRNNCLMYQWFFNNMPIHGAVENELRLDDIKREDEGKYQVRVHCQHNDKLQVLSNEVNLEVKRNPNQYTARNKVALIIGNSSYRSYGYPLPAVKNDMTCATELFEKMGFKVISLLDLILSEMKRAVAYFCELLSEDSYAILYFLGHGYMYHYKHCLIPWDASQGNDVCESLCIENCIDDVQLKQPKMLMVLVDICRQQVEHSREALFQIKPTNQKSLANKVVFYAASVFEKAYETKSRGLFNMYLLDVLKIPNVTIDMMYGKLKSNFRDSPFDLVKYPQSPEMTTNINDPDRSLWDPIDMEMYYKYGIHQEILWQKMHVLPSNIHIQLPEIGLVILSFIKKMSNVLTMKIEIVNFDNNHNHIKIQLPCEYVDQVLRPVNEYSDKLNLYFDFFNLQRLRKNMTICLKITIENMKDQSQRVQILNTDLINLGTPLMSAVKL